MQPRDRCCKEGSTESGHRPRSSAIAKRNDIPEQCPDCGGAEVERKRSILGLAFGAPLVLIGFLAFFPTLGVSFIAAIFGVFMMVPRHRCRDCGWNERTF